jgi:hypothetical protein
MSASDLKLLHQLRPLILLLAQIHQVAAGSCMSQLCTISETNGLLSVQSADDAATRSACCEEQELRMTPLQESALHDQPRIAAYCLCNQQMTGLSMSQDTAEISTSADIHTQLLESACCRTVIEDPPRAALHDRLQVALCQQC